MNRFGNLDMVIPKYVLMPSFHCIDIRCCIFSWLYIFRERERENERQKRDVRQRIYTRQTKKKTYLLSNSLSIRPYNINTRKSTRQSIIPRCQNKDIEMVFLSIFHLNAGFCKGIDGVTVDIDYIYVFLVADFVEVLFEGWSLFLGLIFGSYFSFERGEK